MCVLACRVGCLVWSFLGVQLDSARIRGSAAGRTRALIAMAPCRAGKAGSADLGPFAAAPATAALTNGKSADAAGKNVRSLSHAQNALCLTLLRC